MTDLKLRAAAELELRKRRQDRLKNYSTQINYYKKNPLDYFAERLGIKKETVDWSLLPEYNEHNWDGSQNPFMSILNSLVKYKWVGVESATGTGKTYIGALICLWFLECFKNSVVVTTAPKQDQLSLHIWKEIGKLYPLFGKGDLTTLRLRMNEDRDDWVAVGFIAGIKANEESSTKAQGFHAEHMLIIFEETPGIPMPIITAFQNTCTAPHNLILAFGNPDHQLDNLHKFCMLDNVEHFRISAFDHPNVVLNNPNFIPGAVSKESINRMLVRYGSDNPLFKSRARGLSPNQAKDSLIMLDWCVKSSQRYNDEVLRLKQFPVENDFKFLGVDVANSEAGDKASLAYGEENVLLTIEDFYCPDSNQLGKREVYITAKEKGISPENIGVDGVGVGAGTVNALKELEFYITDLIGSESAVKENKQESFNNLRSQMYWQMREDLKNEIIVLPKDEDLFADLTTPKWITRNGLIVVESKEDIKKRLGRSPNKGDSAVYWNWIRHRKLNQNNEISFEFTGLKESTELFSKY